MLKVPLSSAIYLFTIGSYHEDEWFIFLRLSIILTHWPYSPLLRHLLTYHMCPLAELAAGFTSVRNVSNRDQARTNSVLSPHRSTSNRICYGANTAQIHSRYGQSPVRFLSEVRKKTFNRLHIVFKGIYRILRNKRKKEWYKKCTRNPNEWFGGFAPFINHISAFCRHLIYCIIFWPKIILKPLIYWPAP